VQGVYPPGSTFKIVTALAALHSGQLKLADKIYCPGYLKVGKRIFHCWKHGGHGWLDLQGAITQSCDVFFYTAAQRCGIAPIAAMAKRMGLGEAPDLPISAIASGLTPNKQWKRKHRGQDWLIGDTINSAIGQGYVLASPLQLAMMVARLAAGKAVVPRLVKSVDSVDVPVVPARPLDLKPAFVDAVRKGTWGVVNGIHGTAHYARIADPAMIMAGKTGTAQVRNITAAERAAGLRPNELPWRERDHALFVAYAPFDAPKVAVGVVVEHGGPDHEAAPIGRDALLYALTGGVPPLSAIPRYYRQKAKDEYDSLKLRDIQPQPPARTRA
jgi:penicillin-binding protein 2